MNIIDILKTMRCASSQLPSLQKELIEALNELTSLDWCLLPQEGEKPSEATPLLLPDLENLMQALKHNPSVKRLDLRGHQIGDAGIQTITRILRHNTTLTSLFIERNEITNNGLFALLDQLEFNKTLLSLDPEQEAMMRPDPDLSQRFLSDSKRISCISSQIGTSRACAAWSWPKGNSLCLKDINWKVERLLFNQLDNAESQLQATRAMNYSIFELSNTLAYEQIKAETISGALVGAAAAGAGTFFGLVGAPAALPIVFTLGLSTGIRAAYKSSTTSFSRAARIIHTQIASEENLAPAPSLSLEKEALEDEPVIIDTPAIDNNLRILRRPGFAFSYRR